MAKPALLDPRERIVGGHFPLHVDRARRHPAETVQYITDLELLGLL